jgi:hypothetical protein
MILGISCGPLCAPDLIYAEAISCCVIEMPECSKKSWTKAIRREMANPSVRRIKRMRRRIRRDLIMLSLWKLFLHLVPLAGFLLKKSWHNVDGRTSTLRTEGVGNRKEDRRNIGRPLTLVGRAYHESRRPGVGCFLPQRS